MIRSQHRNAEHTAPPTTPPVAGGPRRPSAEDWSATLHIGVPRETKARETRVAATPETVTKLVGLGYDVVVESGAGEGSSFPDEAYAEAGATIGTAEQAWSADVVLKVNAPATDEIGRLRDGATLISLLS